MASLDWHTTRAGSVSLVELLVTAPVPTRVSIENCLDGPVWPPRREGVPAAGWTDDGFEGVVRDRLVLGYASPAESVDPPARLVSETPLGTDEPVGESQPTADELVRALGDAAPPRDAIDPSRSPSDSSADGPPRPDCTDDPSDPPPAVDEWLDAVEGRLAAAERLDDASSVAEATAAVEAVGGPDAVAALRDHLAADRRALTRFRDRCDALLARGETVDVPVETLRRLA